MGTIMNTLFTAAEVAKKRNVTVETVHNLVRESELSCGQITLKDRFAETQLEAFIDSHWRA